MELSRRDLLKAGGIGALSVVGASALAGCAGNPSSQDITDKIAAPLSEEERVASISDPIYMGSQTNASGQQLVIGTGKNGQIANQAMIDKHVEYEAKLNKVTDRVYCAQGNGMSNSSMIIT